MIKNIYYENVNLQIDSVNLPGVFALPDLAAGLVIFAHGSGSSHQSPRNKLIADILNERGIGTLLFDLLTDEEGKIYENRFDIDLLTQRLLAATNWVIERQKTEPLPIGYFGASTGAAAALKAALTFGPNISAIVSRGGRPDLLLPDELSRVKSPTLFIVGQLDREVLALNLKAFEQIGFKEKRLHIIPGATHLFEEPGTLEQVANVSADWLEEHLCHRKSKSTSQFTVSRDELD